MPLLQVTLGAGATQVSTQNIFCRQIFFQNNAANVVRVGNDNTVSATKGMALAPAAGGNPGGSLNSGPSPIYYTYLSDWWLFGTAAQVIDVLYIL